MVVVGEPTVGKSTLVKHLEGDAFSKNYIMVSPPSILDPRTRLQDQGIQDGEWRRSGAAYLGYVGA